jgi:serine/threonine protein kinase
MYITGLLFSEAIGIWSLGCIMAELILGDWPLYPGTSQYDQMRYICETQGLPPEHMLTFASNSLEFFNIDVDCTTPVWTLKVCYGKNVGFSACHRDRFLIAFHTPTPKAMKHEG